MLCILSVIFSMLMILLFIKKNFKNISLNKATFILGCLTAIYIILTNSDIRNIGKIICLDELEKIYIKQPRISGWHISHFSLFFIIGLISPKFYAVLLFGLLWEVFEHVYGVYTNKEKYWTSGGKLGQMTDIVMNGLGFLTGSYLSKYI